MLTPGDVVLALFYYSDYRGAKVRPSVVVSGQAFTEQTGQIIICSVSSKPPRNQFEVSLQGWQDAGLRFPSKVQAGKLLTVDARLVKNRCAPGVGPGRGEGGGFPRLASS